MIPVIIPYFRAPEKIEKCKEALSKQSEELTVFIRDNSDDNILYTAAINEGLKRYAYTHEFVLVLTQDAYLAPDCLSELVKAMNDNPTCGIISPRQYAGNQITWAGSLEAWPAGKHTASPETVPYGTYWANGACMLLRSEMIKDIGTLDHNMRFICSDADYSFTARSRGWSVMVAPNARCEHELDGSGSMGKNPWLDTIKLRDMIYFTEKWLTKGLFDKLSFEGKTTSPDKIKTQLKSWRKGISLINESLSLAPSSEPQPELSH